MDPTTAPQSKSMLESNRSYPENQSGRADWFKLSAQQAIFLRKLTRDLKTPRELMDELGVKPLTFSKWRRNNHFRLRLADCLRYVRFETYVTQQINGARVAWELNRFLNQEPGALPTEKIVALEGIARRAQTRRPRHRRGRRPKHDPLPADMTEAQAAALLGEFDAAGDDESDQVSSPDLTARESSRISRNEDS